MTFSQYSAPGSTAGLSKGISIFCVCLGPSVSLGSLPCWTILSSQRSSHAPSTKSRLRTSYSFSMETSPRGEVRRRDVNPLVDLLDLGQRGIGLAVRLDQAVAAEVVVVRDVAEVAAVAPVALAFRRLLADALIDPVPHESPDEALVRADGLPVFGQIADAVAHRVDVFAQDHRAGVVVGRQADDAGNSLVHPADHIDVGVIERIAGGAFVVDRAGRVVVVDPAGHRGVVRAAAGLVAQRPDHHAGVVLVPLDHADRPLHEGGVPGGDVREQAADAVGFEVGLVHHVDAVLVAQLVHAADRWDSATSAGR